MSAPVPRVAPYGSWASPVTAASLSTDTVTILEPRFDGDDVLWLEGRPADGGRVVVVRRSADGRAEDVVAAPYNVRSRVHEYGGGGYDVADRVLVFSNFDDRRVYSVELADPGSGGSAARPIPITPAGDLRFGDLRISPDGRWVVAVCEDHGVPGAEPANRLVRLDINGPNDDGGVVLVEGHDFVSSGAWDADGTRLAWVQWDHPDMPWDASELCVADIDADGRLSSSRVVAGGAGESVSQPVWAPDGRLVFTSDRTGWWNLYAWSDGSEPEPLWPADREFADPQWLLGMSSYGIDDRGLLVCSWLVDGYVRLGTVDLASGERSEIDCDASAVNLLRVGAGGILVVAGYADRPTALVRLDPRGATPSEVLRATSPTGVDPAYVSVPDPVTWHGADGEEVYGFYSRPHNPDFRGGVGELPPLVVMSHGGPTGMSRPMFDRSVQFWTTRGIGVLTVNYGGSSGYGRAYRERLRGAWGIVDVSDCASGAQAMVARGLADPSRLVIRGGSAGGYTTLAALTFRDVFTAGASLFGVGDLETLTQDTHKFESRYLDGLIGPYPEARDLYVERSPIHHVERISCPVILLQGRQDRVVPPSQAESMAAAIRANGLPVALLVFEEEGHGFRLAQNQIRAIEAEAYFYSRVLGFELADDVQPVEIENLTAAGSA